MAQDAPQDVAATITAPTNGAVNVDVTSKITWTASAGALSYYLYVGTTAGAKDLIDTGEIQATQYPLSKLAGGMTVYARLWTKFASGWKWTDISFTTRAASFLITPQDNATQVDPRVMFQWAPVAGVQAYYLYVGTTRGANDVVNTGEVLTLSYRPKSPLPAAVQLYATLWTKANGVWASQESTFTTQALALFLTPANGDMEVDTSKPITWTAVAGAQSYYLYVGSSSGAKDYINSGEKPVTSYSMTSLPLGKLMYARLYTKFNNGWHYTEISFRTKPAARFIAPKDGAVQVPKDQIASWTPVDGADVYYLTAGSSAGARDYIDSGEITATSYSLAKLPIGVTAYLRLYTKFQGVWRSVDATIGTEAMARLVAPVNGATAVARHSRITWTPVPGVQAYYLYVGTVAGANDVINSGETLATSYAADSIPPGQTVFVRLWTRRDNAWKYSDSSFTTRSTAVIDGIKADGTPIDSTTQLQWNPIAGATVYYVYAGTAPGLSDLANSGEISATSYSLPGLPGGQTVYVRLYTFVNGHWVYEDYSLVTTPRSYLVQPSSGAQDVYVIDLALRWNAVAGAAAYRVQLGTASGASDLWVSGDLGANSVQVPPLPGNTDIFVRLSVNVGGTWSSTDSQFRTAAISQLKYPSANSIDADLSKPFEWTAVAGSSGYSIQIGSLAGASDLVNSGAIGGTSLSGTNLPANQPLFVRIGSLTDGRWRYVESVVEAGQAAAPLLVYPQDGAQSVDASAPFQWVRDPPVISYRLTIGTSLHAHDVYDSPSIRINRRFVRGLPVGQPLFGTLFAQYANGIVSSTDFSFTATSASIPASAELAEAKWATSAIRSMALVDNVPYANTVLADVARSEKGTDVNCVSYAAALLAVLGQLDVTAQSRVLNVCLSSSAALYECHTLVEYFDLDANEWILLDPTFGLTVHRASDGTFATAMDISAATRNMDWSSLSYEFLTVNGDAYATGYYVDYPTLYANILGAGSQPINTPVATILPFFDFVGSAVMSARDDYALQCAAGESNVTANVDGADVTLPCLTPDGLTHVFNATDIAASAGSALSIYRVHRFTF